MRRAAVLLVLCLCFTLSEVKGQSPTSLLDVTGCPQAVVTAAANCLSGTVSADGTFDASLTSQLTNSSLATMCAAGGCLATLRDAVKGADKSCIRLMGPIRNICSTTVTPSGVKYCAADLLTVIPRLLLNRAVSSGTVSFTSANPTATEYSQLCDPAVNPCFSRAIQIIKSVVGDPKTSALAPLPLFGDAFCAKVDTAYCFDDVRAKFAEIQPQTMTASIDTLKTSINDLNLFCSSSNACSRFALAAVTKGQVRKWKANKDKNRSDNGSGTTMSAQVNIFELLKTWLASACQTTTLSDGTTKLVGLITKDDFVNLVLTKATTTVSRMLANEANSAKPSSQKLATPAPPSKGKPSDKMPQGVKAGCAQLNQTIAALGCGALPVMNFRMMLAKNNIKPAANSANPVMGNNFTSTPGLLRAMENPQAVCGVASGAGCSNGATKPQVTTAVPLPALDCSKMTANVTAMQGICDLLGGVKTSLVDSGAVDDPTQMTAASLCGITLDMCQAAAAVETPAARRLLSSNDNTLSLSVATADSTSAALLTMQMGAGVATDAVSASIQSLTGTSASLISSTAVEPTLSSDPTTAVSQTTYTPAAPGTAVETAPTTSDVAAANSPTSTTKASTAAKNGGLIWITLAALVILQA